MRYHVLACDYDGTLALHGTVDDPTITALERCRDSGRKLLLVTGRRLEELSAVCARIDLFEWLVAENGVLLLHPATREFKLRAANLTTFVHLAAGVDGETWNHRLRHGDYSTWFRDSLSDDTLADDVVAIERHAALTAGESRRAVAALIETRYPLAADPATSAAGQEDQRRLNSSKPRARYVIK